MPNGHRRVVSQPMGHKEMRPPQEMGRALGGDAPFGPRPTPDQLPPYSGRVNSPQPQVQHPPAALLPGGHTERQLVQPPDGSMVSGASSLDGVNATRTGTVR